jgi:2-dehydropantoate 2-reductase
MKIAVMGAGAMGSLFGGLLAEAGEDVTLIEVWKEHVDALNARGLRITGISGERTIEVNSTTDPGKVGPVDLVIIFVKSYDTAEAARDALPMVSDETVFLSLQNGLGNIDKIAEAAGRKRIIRGVTAQGSTMMGPGEIYHAGQGLTVIGEPDETSTERVERIAKAFKHAGIHTKISSNIMGALWSKVLVNVGINPLTALTGLRNGELLDHPEIRQVMRRAVEEATMVAQSLGIEMEFDNPVEKVYEVAEATAANRSSMLQDVERGRKTEIDALNGAIVELGRLIGVDTPVNYTLVTAVKGLESVRRREIKKEAE